MGAPEPSGWPDAVQALERRLGDAFDRLLAWVESGNELLDYRIGHDAWSVRQVLEHVSLTDRFLLILARKIRDRSAKRAVAGERWPEHPPRFEHLEQIAGRDFRWPHPTHMTPTGTVPPTELAQRLAADRGATLELLASVPPGQGTLHRIRMSVIEEDDRLDLYQFLMVIVLHAERHARQIERTLEHRERAHETDVSRRPAPRRPAP